MATITPQQKSQLISGLTQLKTGLTNLQAKQQIQPQATNTGYGTSNVHPQGYAGLSWGQMEEQGIDPNTGLSKVTALSADTTQPQTPTQPPVNPRQQALDYLKGLGYASPDEGEIQSAMKEQIPKVPPPIGTTPTGQQNLAQKYKQSFATPPTDVDLSQPGLALGAVKKAQPPQVDTTAIDTFFQEDPLISKITQSFTELMSPPKQTETLLSQYQGLLKSSGLESINSELINTKRIIEGTEDDIRSEVTAANGFATDSQVLAMASARNKTLIQNYNALLATRDSIKEQINTSMQLIQEDRKMANERVSQQLDLGLKILDYRDKMQNNAREAYNNIIKTSGYGGLYAALQNTPYELGIAEKALGIPSGGMANLATYQAPLTEKDKLELEETKVGLDLKRQQIETEKAQRAKIYADINKEDVTDELSNTTKAIINNPSLFDDLTPTEKGKVITELQVGGYDTSNLGLKGLSDTAIQNVAQTQKALDDLGFLKEKIQGNIDKLGPITGLAALNPWSASRKLQADVDRVRQTVGKALEGGVLRKEDEEKYKKILATLTDTPDTASYKIDALIGSLTRDIENYKSLQQSAGRSLDVGANLKKTGEITKPEDLRKKYNY